MSRILDFVGIDASCGQSRQDALSAPSMTPGMQRIGIGGTGKAPMRLREVRQTPSNRRIKLLTATAAILLAVVLFLACTQTLSPSSKNPARMSASLSSLWVAESNIVDARFGSCVSSAGDVNNDGYDDVLVGAYNYSGDQIVEGRAYLFLGGPTGLQPSPSWTVDGDQNWACLGLSLASAGDVNNDGCDDVIIGEPIYENGSAGEGRALVFLGTPSGLTATPSWAAECDQTGARFGYSVSSAGDVNDDGYDDVVVGAYSYDNGSDDEGCAFVYLGSSSGLSATPSWSAESDQESAYFGHSVSSAGDVNNDGFGDVIVGAHTYDDSVADEGRVYLYLGSSSGLAQSPSWTAESNQSLSFFGYSVSSAGDVNNDHYDDVIVGSHSYDNGQSEEGRAYVYYGSSSGLPSTPSWIAECDLDWSRYGYSVACAGDVDNDGYDDVVVGSHYYTNGTSNEGAAFLYLGSSIGLPASPSWSVESGLNMAWFGCSVSSAGDVNGDGADEVLVGAWGYANGEADEGRAYLYGGVAIPEFDALVIPIVGVLVIVVALRRRGAEDRRQ